MNMNGYPPPGYPQQYPPQYQPQGFPQAQPPGYGQPAPQGFPQAQPPQYPPPGYGQPAPQGYPQAPQQVGPVGSPLPQGYGQPAPAVPQANGGIVDTSQALRGSGAASVGARYPRVDVGTHRCRLVSYEVIQSRAQIGGSQTFAIVEFVALDSSNPGEAGQTRCTMAEVGGKFPAYHHKQVKGLAIALDPENRDETDPIFTSDQFLAWFEIELQKGSFNGQEFALIATPAVHGKGTPQAGQPKYDSKTGKVQTNTTILPVEVYQDHAGAAGGHVPQQPPAPGGYQPSPQQPSGEIPPFPGTPAPAYAIPAPQPGPQQPPAPGGYQPPPGYAPPGYGQPQPGPQPPPGYGQPAPQPPPAPGWAGGPVLPTPAGGPPAYRG